MESTDKINLQILKIKNLPELSAASFKIINAVNDPDISIDELASVISVSPVLAGRLLGLANSAYFGYAGEITDLRVAIIRVLGINLVKSLTLGVLLNLELDTGKCNRFNSERFWMDALLTATLSQQFSLLLHDEAVVPSTSYTAGLLLNIGLIVAIYLLPEESNMILLNAEENGSSISEEMASLLGKNQYELGGILLEHWHLPATYQTVLKEFKNGAYCGKENKMISLIRIGFAMAKKILSGHYDELPPLLKQLESFELSAEVVQPVIDNVLAKKDNVYQAALQIAGK
ncbi:MAG: HDOD domain-containing protein [Methylococcales bacterium]|nr:HDOD domain-containing protein [Methylococcales bacterium]